jgi:Ca2+-transporting ATPase
MKHEQLGGLSSHEVAARRRRDGFNELPDREKRNIFTMIISVLSEPMIFLLVAVVVVYFLLGDHSEAMVLMVSVLVVISIEVYQDGKTEKALESEL